MLLNNDMELISPDWLQELLMHAQRPEVGIVGAKLYFPDDTIQHAGVILDKTMAAVHVFYHEKKKSSGLYEQTLLCSESFGGHRRMHAHA